MKSNYARTSFRHLTRRFALAFLIIFSLQGFIYADGVGLLTSKGDGIPLFLSRVSDQLILTETEKYTDGRIIPPDELKDRLSGIEGGSVLLEDCADSECATELARLLGLDVLITAEISNAPGGYSLRMSAVEPDGNVIGSTAESIFDIRDFDDGVARAAESLAIAAGLIEAPERPTEVTAVAAGAAAATDNTTAEANGVSVDSAQPSAGDESRETPADEDPPADFAAVEPADELPPLGGSRTDAIMPGEEQNRLRRAAFIGSAVVLQLGSLANMVTYIADTEAVTSYYLYLGASDQGDLDRYYQSYENLHLTSRVAAVSAYSLNGLALPAAAYALFGGEPGELAFSRRGRQYLYSGLAATIAGNLFYLRALDSMAEASYYGGRAELDNDPAVEYYRNRAAESSAAALVMEAAVIGLWGLGSAALISAPMQEEGRLKPLAPNFWDKVLMQSGFIFLSGGNILASQAAFRRTAAAEAYYKYLRAGFDEVQASYQQVEDEFDSFYLTSGIAAGLWLAGAACFVTAELFDFPDSFAASGSKSVLSALRLAPTYNGGVLYVHLEL